MPLDYVIAAHILRAWASGETSAVLQDKRSSEPSFWHFILSAECLNSAMIAGKERALLWLEVSCVLDHTPH